MAGPQHGIVGDDANYGLDIPETQVDDYDYQQLQKSARFSRTAEFKELKKHLESRIEFYQVYLPNGEPVIGKTTKQLDGMWIVANCIIGECKSIISAYEQAADAAKEAAAKRKAASGI